MQPLQFVASGRGPRGRRADADHFSAWAPSTITVGGVELYRRAISFNAAGGPDGGGPDGDYIWIFEAQISHEGETEVNEVYVRDSRSAHPRARSPRCRRQHRRSPPPEP